MLARRVRVRVVTAPAVVKSKNEMGWLMILVRYSIRKRRAILEAVKLYASDDK